MNKEPRLRFTDEERSAPALEKPICKADRAAAKADKAQAKIPKKQVRRTSIDPETGKVTTKLVLEDKKKPPSKLSHAVRDAPGDAVLGKLHKEIRETEQDNVGRGERPQIRGSCRDRRSSGSGGLPQPQAETLPQGGTGRAKAGKSQCKRPIPEVFAGKSQLASNPFSRWQQKQAIKKEYAAAKRAGQTQEKPQRLPVRPARPRKPLRKRRSRPGAFVMRHKKGFGIVLALFLVVCLLMNTISSCSMLGQGIGSVVTGSTYPSDDPELLAVGDRLCRQRSSVAGRD